MAELFASGRVVDLILALVALEAALLALRRRLAQRGPSVMSLLPNLLSGAFLLIALRTALTHSWWGWIALCVLAALAAHLIDLNSRLAQAPGRR
jgi:hypothetical protein